MLYHSDSFVVVQFELPAAEAGTVPRGGFEIVDKLAGKEIWLDGAVAASFKAGIDALVEREPTEDAVDDFISGYTQLAQQPLTLH